MRAGARVDDVRSAIVHCVTDKGRDPRKCGIVVGPDNENLGWLTPEAAARLVTDDVCVAISPRPDLLVLDFDRPDDDNATRALDECLELLRTCGARIVRVASGRKGHMHVWAAGVETWCRQLVEQTAANHRIDIRKGSKLIRPPGAAHRLGLDVKLLEPATFDQALDLLSLRPEEQGKATPVACPEDRGLTPAPELRELVADLPPDLVELLCNPRAVKRFGGDRSRLDMSAFNKAANAGVNPNRLFQLLMRPDVPGGAKVRSKKGRGVSSPQGYFWLTWSKAQATRWIPTIVTKADAVARLDVVARAAQQWQPPSPRTRGTDAAVLLAAISIGRQQGGTKVAMSARALAERAGVSKNTVPAAIRRLEAFGWFIRRRRHFEDTAAIYELVVPLDIDLETLSEPNAQDSDTYTNPLGGVGLSQNCAIPRHHDVFRHGALGKRAPACLEALSRCPMTTGQLAEAVGGHEGSARRWVRRLQEAGLCRRGPDGRWQLSKPVDANLLDRVAANLGVAGVGERQRARHQQERRQFSQALAERYSADVPDNAEGPDPTDGDQLDGPSRFPLPRTRTTTTTLWRRKQRVLVPLIPTGVQGGGDGRDTRHQRPGAAAGSEAQQGQPPDW